MQKAIFLDRDGVINIDKGYVYKIEDFEFCQGVFEALYYFQSLGYILIVVTNQSGIGRGYYCEEDFETLSVWMCQEFLLRNIRVDKVYYCPHTPNDDCNCRKPKSGMFQQALKAFNIDAKQSWMIGDKQSDIVAARGIGIEKTILFGNSQNSGAKYCVNGFLDTIDIIQS